MSNHPATILEVFLIAGEKAAFYPIPTENYSFALIALEKEKHLLNYFPKNSVIAERDEETSVTFFWIASLNYRIADPKFYFRECLIGLWRTRTEKYRL